MSRPALVLALASIVMVALAPAGAGELGGLATTGPLARDLAPRAERTPREALIGVDRARRALDGDRGIEAERMRRRLADIERDAERKLRRRSLAEDLAEIELAPERFPLPDAALPPYPRDIGNRDNVIGAGKGHLRPGGLRAGPAPAPTGPLR